MEDEIASEVQKYEGEILAYENIVESMKTETAAQREKFTEALTLAQTVLEMSKKKDQLLDNLFILSTLQGLVGIMENYKQFERTLAMYNELYELSMVLFGGDSLDTISVQKNIDQVLEALGKLDEAVALHHKVWDIKQKSLEVEVGSPPAEGYNLKHIFQDSEDKGTV